MCFEMREKYISTICMEKTFQKNIIHAQLKNQTTI